jgi:hypothetical protein
MNEITAAIYNLLKNDSTLAGYLTTYKSNPAILSGFQIPEGVSYPRLHIMPVVSDFAFDSKTFIGQTLTYEIRAQVKEAESQSKVSQIAQRVRTLLHRTTSLSVTGFNVIQVLVTNIGLTQAGEDVIALSVFVEVTII